MGGLGRGRPAMRFSDLATVGPGSAGPLAVFGRTLDMMTPQAGQIRSVGSQALPHFGHAAMPRGV
jgi:hypothetical protein